MSYSETPSTSPHAGSMSRGTARSINSSGRSVALPHDLLQLLRLHQQVRRRGGGDDDVGARERVGELVEAHRIAAEPPREADRAVLAARGDERDPRAAVSERASGQLAHLAGADDDPLAAGQVAEQLAGEHHADGREAQLALADRRLGAHPLAGGERGLEQVVGERSDGLARERRVVGALDLTLDLRLADDHRLEPGGDAVQVAGGVAVAVRVDRAGELGRPDVRLAGRASTARGSRPRRGR